MTRILEIESCTGCKWSSSSGICMHPDAVKNANSVGDILMMDLTSVPEKCPLPTKEDYVESEFDIDSDPA